jgi:hypothetical protein
MIVNQVPIRLACIENVLQRLRTIREARVVLYPAHHDRKPYLILESSGATDMFSYGPR